MINPHERETGGDLNTVVSLTLVAEIVLMMLQVKEFQKPVAGKGE